MHISTLENTSLTTLTAAFNAAFADYMVPMHLTEEQQQLRFAREDIQMQWSTGAFTREGELVGLMVHGLRDIDGQKVAYNAGTGVIPAYRGQSLTARQYDFILEKFRKAGVNKVMLEVIDSNAPAVHTYAKLGFVTLRELDCFSGIPKPAKASVDIRPLQQPDWKQLRKWWEVEPTWQNAVPTVRNMGDAALCLGAFADGELIGYVIAPDNGRVMHCAVAPERRGRGIALALLNALHQRLDKPLVFINVEAKAGSPGEFLLRNGFKRTVGQFEMALPL